MMPENIRSNRLAPRKEDSKLAKEIDSGNVSITYPSLPKMKRNEVRSTSRTTKMTAARTIQSQS